MSFTRYTTEAVMVSPVSLSRLNHILTSVRDLMDEPRPSSLRSIWTRCRSASVYRRHPDLGAPGPHGEGNVAAKCGVPDDVVKPVASMLSSPTDALSECGL